MDVLSVFLFVYRQLRTQSTTKAHTQMYHLNKFHLTEFDFLAVCARMGVLVVGLHYAQLNQFNTIYLGIEFAHFKKEPHFCTIFLVKI